MDNFYFVVLFSEFSDNFLCNMNFFITFFLFFISKRNYSFHQENKPKKYSFLSMKNSKEEKVKKWIRFLKSFYENFHIFKNVKNVKKKSEILPILLEWIYCKISIIFPNQKLHKKVRKKFQVTWQKIKLHENKKQIQIKPKFLTFFNAEILH